MARPKLRSKDSAASPATAESQSVALPPLRISGVVVKKADLVEALRIYVPSAVDIQAFEDGENFLVVLGNLAGESGLDQKGAEP